MPLNDNYPKPVLVDMVKVCVLDKLNDNYPKLVLVEYDKAFTLFKVYESDAN